MIVNFIDVRLSRKIEGIDLLQKPYKKAKEQISNIAPRVPNINPPSTDILNIVVRYYKDEKIGQLLKDGLLDNKILCGDLPHFKLTDSLKNMVYLYISQVWNS